MLDYTRAIFHKTKKDLDTALTFFQFGTQILYITYLICILFTKSSIWYLYLSLLIISVAFLAFDIATRYGIKSLKDVGISLLGNKERKEKLYRVKQNRRNIRKIKFYTSHILKLSVLASSLYPIIASPYSVHPIHIILATVMAFLWIMQIVFEILRLILEDRFDLFIEAMHADIERITKPVNTVKNAFKKLVGKEVEEPAEPTKERIYLDSLVEQRKAEKEAAKAEKAAEKAKNEEYEADEDTEKRSSVSEWLSARISALKKKEKTESQDVIFTDATDDTESDI